jgi:hypothetical protein
VPQQGRSIRPRQEVLLVVPVVPVGPDYTYGYSPAPAYGG